ncbi:putative capsular polysaccharide synthesis family protein [Roseivivax sediminis]|uniref:Capsular polysaccharide synthesis protein n=1 Tax=Roseivivax sediminis TaxID=936889 RepID=A0A1I2CV80_9RHOB|nr:putative capsular polysaccharide synthesis family protein [Roseivivax sediminis]SFE72178.1 Putative capsular polysaccharide synthesis protein [Roseivivax sediminis]
MTDTSTLPDSQATAPGETPRQQEQNKAFATPRNLGAKLRMWFDPQHICVLTIGKTASSAIIQGFVDAGVPAYQAHTLHRAPQEYLFVDGLPERPLQNAAFQVKTRSWLALTQSRPKRFVTTFRDPFARNMSAFFEQSWKLGVKVEDMTTEELIALYEKHGPHDTTRTWFAQNLARPFGLNIAEVNLRDQPVQVLVRDKRRFLLMKYENQAPWETSLSDFAGKPVQLERRNDSKRKSYSDAITRLKATWRPAPQIVRRTLDVALWDALYTSEEKQAIRTRWDIPETLAP